MRPAGDDVVQRGTLRGVEVRRLQLLRERVERALGGEERLAARRVVVVAAVLGTGAAFVINAAAYVVSAWCISGVPIPATPTLEQSSTGRPRNGWQDFWHGMRYMGARPLVLRLLSVKAWSSGMGGGLLILFALFAEHLFQAGAVGMGTLYMTRGLGAVLGRLGPAASAVLTANTGRRCCWVEIR